MVRSFLIVIHAIVAVTTLNFWVVRSSQAAWTQTPGEGLIIVRLDASQLQPERGRKRKKIEISSYAVYGLWEGFTLGLIARGEQIFPTRGGGPELTDVTPFFRARVAKGNNWVISTESAVSLPISNAAPHLSAPDESWALEGTLLGGIGGPVNGMHGFGVLGVGWRNRFGDGENALKLQATAGLWPSDELMLIAQSFTTLEIGTPLTGIPPRRNITKLQASMVYKLTEQMSVELGGRFEKALNGNGRAQALFLGLWTRY